MAGLSVYNGPPTSSLGIPNAGVQGGRNVAPSTALGPQPRSTYQVQPSAPSTYVTNPLPVYTSHPASSGVSAPIPTTYHDNYGNTFTTQDAANASNNHYSTLGTQRNSDISAIGTAEDQAANSASDYFNYQALPFITNLRSSQLSINQGRENSAMNHLSSIHDLLDQVRQGIQSFGVTLANRNAGSSGAAEAAAKAYGVEGGRQKAGVDQQYNLDQRNLDTQQQGLDANSNTTLSLLHGIIKENTDAITSDTQTKLEQLNSDAAYAGLSPLDIASLRKSIVAEGQAKLQGLGTWLDTQMATIKPEDQTSAEATGYKLYTSGAPAPGQYSFDVSSPDITGAPVSQVMPLPVYTGKNKDSSLA